MNNSSTDSVCKLVFDDLAKEMVFVTYFYPVDVDVQ